MMEKGNVFPIIYNFTDLIVGAGFIADVWIKGRATAVQHFVVDKQVSEQEFEQWWFNGVEPGSLAEGGDSLNESYYRFKQSLKQILVELAYDSADFQTFKQAVEEFTHEISEPEEKDFLQAVEAIRAGTLEAPKKNMRREKAESTALVNVTKVADSDTLSDALTPDRNRADGDFALAKAA